MKKLVAVLTAFVVAACSGTPTPEPAPRISVVTTISTLADLVQNVAGDRAEVYPLVPHGGDPHTFDPSPSEAVRVSQADMLVMNGLGLDEWLTRFIETVGADGVPLVELAEDLPAVDYLEGGGEHSNGDEPADEDDHAINPHLWLNVGYARLYVERIVDELSTVDPDGEAVYRANAAAYETELDALDDWIREQVATIPETDRRIVSFHDAFPYFAHAYGFEIVGVLVEVPGKDPSPGEVARLITAIRETGVRLILAESQFSDALAQTVAAEANATVVRELYTDTLGDAPADTLIGAMRWNVEQITQALR